MDLGIGDILFVIKKKYVKKLPLYEQFQLIEFTKHTDCKLVFVTFKSISIFFSTTRKLHVRDGMEQVAEEKTVLKSFIN